ncbi:hypothetical protein DIPPA_03542 [Diplonema papillatum]|nr:hypothetical protein DIPPA_03542 [Diplonema papillatum]
MKHPMAGQPTIIVEDVADYRAVIPLVLQPGDCVLEVGCHEGVTTRRIAKTVGEAGTVIGVDTSEMCIEKAKVAYNAEPNLQFHVGSAMDVSFLLKLADRRYDVVFVDISGSRDLETLIPLMESYEFALKPRHLIVKSFRLKRLYMNCRCFEFLPSQPGVKAAPQGRGSWRTVVEEDPVELPAATSMKYAKGNLPRTEDGEMDASLLPVSASKNKSLAAWGSGRQHRLNKRKEKGLLKRNDPVLRSHIIAQNVVRGEEEHTRASINRDFDSALLSMCRASRTVMRTENRDNTKVRLQWGKPMGAIKWIPITGGPDAEEPLTLEKAPAEPSKEVPAEPECTAEAQ